MGYYKDGNLVMVGDLVRGNARAVKHEIVGKVVQIDCLEFCSLAIAHVGSETRISPFSPYQVQASIAFGDARDFIKIA